MILKLLFKKILIDGLLLFLSTALKLYLGLTKEQIKTNSDELYKFLTENPIVPQTVVQKVIAFRNQKNLKDIVMLDEYDFYPNFDSRNFQYCFWRFNKLNHYFLLFFFT